MLFAESPCGVQESVRCLLFTLSVLLRLLEEICWPREATRQHKKSWGGKPSVQEKVTFKHTYWKTRRKAKGEISLAFDVSVVCASCIKSRLGSYTCNFKFTSALFIMNLNSSLLLALFISVSSSCLLKAATFFILFVWPFYFLYKLTFSLLCWQVH